MEHAENKSPYLAKSVGDKFIALLLSMFCIFLLVSLFSFSPLDTSPFSQSFPKQSVTNYCGLLGAYLAGSFVYFLGISAFLLVLPMIHLFLTAIVKSISHRGYSFFSFGWALIILSISYFIERGQLIISIDDYDLEGSGAVGFYIKSIFDLYLGQVGSLIVVFFLSIIGLDFLLPFWFLKSFSKRWQSFIKKTGKSATQASLTHNILQEKDKLDNTQPIIEEFEIEKFDSIISSPKRLDIKKSFEQAFQVSLQEDNQKKADESEIENIKASIIKTLSEFGIKGEIVGVISGPVITIYEFLPDSGIKQARIQNLIDDLALALKVESLFIQPIPQKQALGIQVPNLLPKLVRLGDIIYSPAFQQASSPLSIAIGMSIYGKAIIRDLSSMPHLLIAGATGSGKSVGINTIICSLIYKCTPDVVRMIFVDPKMLELSIYEGIPHLLTPVITDPKKASMALAWAINEMERRYALMQTHKVRNIESYNELIGSLSPLEKLSYIVVVIDELADLMLTAAKEVETAIQRLAQKARASGIHLILATQRPSVDVITGVIKANLPTRIAFQVASKHDSRTILDQIGAEKLLGKGDMLLLKPGAAKPVRIQGAFVTDQEVCKFVENVKSAYKNMPYNQELMDWFHSHEDSYELNNSPGEEDVRYQDAIEIARQNGSLSASYLQRQLKIGYNRAARIVETMAAQGLLSEADGAKPRKWLG